MASLTGLRSVRLKHYLCGLFGSRAKNPEHYTSGTFGMFLDENLWMTYPIAVDNQQGTTCPRYGVTAFPTAVLIGRDGKVIQTGGLSGPKMLLRVRDAVFQE